MAWYRHAARLQAVSTAVAAAITEEIPDAWERIITIPPYLSNAEGTAGHADRGGAREKRVLYLGRIHPEKGVHLLIEAFIRYAPAGWRLQVSGSHRVRDGGGGEGYLRGLQQAAARDSSRIEFTGAVPPDDLNKQFYRSSLLVYPSIAETGESFGVVPLEAMACGCPAIVSDLACFRDYLSPGLNGYVFNHRGPGAVESLGRVLREALTDPAVRSKMAEAGYRTSLGYSLEAVATLFMSDFARMAQSARA
jgi:glycosyltransferase involved in cell wall biosynthesis